MRDILVTLIVLGGCLYTFQRPYIGVLLWSWLSYMNPHRLAYGFAHSMPFSQMVAISLLAALLFNQDKKALPINGLTIIWIFFVFYMGLTSLFAYFPDIAMPQYIKVFKIQLIVFLTMMLITDMVKLRQLIWVIVLSIGFYSIKGGVFTLLTGGGYRVWGPPFSFIEDNNELAIAILMVIPLMIYLYQTTTNKWIKRGLIFAVVTSLFTVLGSQSRGALLAILTVGGFFWLKSQSKMLTGAAIMVLAVALLAFMPESWFNRMDTIENFEEDASAMGRLNAWEYAFHAANDNVLGVGFGSWSTKTFMIYAPNPNDVHAAHSIYFSVLADHGWLGLILFLLIFYGAFRNLSLVMKQTENNESQKEYNLLARMLQIGLIAYLSGGAFLSLSYFDLPWHFVCFSVLLTAMLKKQVKAEPVNKISPNAERNFVK